MVREQLPCNFPMSKQQMLVTKCFTLSNTSPPEELCGRDAEINWRLRKCEAGELCLAVDAENKKARPEDPDGP
jgi:hypothetical protein